MRFLFVFFLCLPVCLWADVPSEQAAEVQHLINYLAESDCVMIRNGKEHTGEEGAEHVQRKYDHFRDDIESTEEFIEYSATGSLLSKKKYHVQCGTEEPVPSRDWLLEELERYRSQS